MIKTGDVIYCHNADDMIRTSKELTNSDIETDFLYEYKGENGYFLEIKRVNTTKSMEKQFTIYLIAKT